MLSHPEPGSAVSYAPQNTKSHQTVTTATLGRICKALGCSPNDILTFEDCNE
ncbi:Predicted transcriptional regulator [Actinomyces bovis]|uniref:Predicted transcriptional regulator n=1 Tax=Actinomyces bovis TaxID=1658 RepID=A0ABY1VPZ5_9ACTO|nr:Predicted transcriptional regulator [Actinomyces bovis]VEG56559.1 Predicted transcriptional regulator [Actinomyces israelii]